MLLQSDPHALGCRQDFDCRRRGQPLAFRWVNPAGKGRSPAHHGLKYAHAPSPEIVNKRAAIRQRNIPDVKPAIAPSNSAVGLNRHSTAPPTANNRGSKKQTSDATTSRAPAMVGGEAACPSVHR
jgi:hypothetical protein